MNRKAQFLDQIAPTITIFMLAVIGLFFVFLFQTLADTFDAYPTADGLMEAGVTAFSNIDVGIGLILIGFYAGALLSGIMVRTHPVLFVIMLFFLIFSAVIVAALGNAWEVIIGTAAFTAVAATHFNITTTIMQNIPLLTGLFVVMWSIGFYAKERIIT